MSEPDLVWENTPCRLALKSGETQVWRIPLDLPVTCLEDLVRTLSEDEQQRAGRFYFQRDRDRFIAARGSLRAILASYLNIRPADLTFSYTPYGKPFLERPVTEPRIEFNLSHSNALGLLAITSGGEVGVDIEFIRPDLADEQIARRYFSQSEVDCLFALPVDDRIGAFFYCWTRKEAYIKARGEGLSLPLDQFDVSLMPGDQAALLRTRPDPGEAQRWRLAAINPAPGYAAALAVRAQKLHLTFWQWNACSSL